MINIFDLLPSPDPQKSFEVACKVNILCYYIYIL